jgi:hypothetical protein
VGLLRDDVAHAVVAAPNRRHGWGRILGSNPRLTFDVGVNGGVPQSLVITWHRQNMASMAWSDLNLRVLDGTTVVGASSTPRNLYEIVRFLPPSSRTYTVEITAASLEGSGRSSRSRWPRTSIHAPRRRCTSPTARPARVAAAPARRVRSASS